jgi:hypothetical protein
VPERKGWRARFTIFTPAQFLSLEVGKPLFVRQLVDVTIQELRVYLPDYKPYRIVLRGSSLGTTVSVYFLVALTHSEDVRNDHNKHSTLFGIAQRFQNGLWGVDMMWGVRPVLHVCPTDGYSTESAFQPGTSTKKNSFGSFLAGTWYIQAGCWGEVVCEYEVLVEELPQLAAPSDVWELRFLFV